MVPLFFFFFWWGVKDVPPDDSRALEMFLLEREGKDSRISFS